MGQIYRIWNGVVPTTAKFVPVTTGTGLKTMLQLATPATQSIKVKAWGISFDGSAAATPGSVELLSCTGAATVTALAATDATCINNPLDSGSRLTYGTSATGFTASAEGTPANVDLLDVQHIAPINQYIYQFPLGDEPFIAVSRFVRVRVQFAAAINAICWVEWEE